MSKLHISDYSTTALNNSDIDTVNVAENSNMSLMNNAHRSNAKIQADFYDDIGGARTATGTVNALVVAGTTQTLAAGQILRFVSSGANTGATTLNWNSLGVKSIKKMVAGSAAALVAGDIRNSAYTLVIYDGTQFILINPAVGSVSLAPDAVLEDQKASSTNGGTSVASTWTTRDLNVKVRDPDGLITLSSNQFTVSVDGWVEWAAPVYASDRHISALYNVTDSTYANGTAQYNNSTNTSATTLSLGGAAVIVGKTYELQHWVETASTTFGFGVGNSAAANYYTRVLFWRT